MGGWGSFIKNYKFFVNYTRCILFSFMGFKGHLDPLPQRPIPSIHLYLGPAPLRYSILEAPFVILSSRSTCVLLIQIMDEPMWPSDFHTFPGHPGLLILRTLIITIVSPCYSSSCTFRFILKSNSYRAFFFLLFGPKYLWYIFLFVRILPRNP